MSIMTSSALRYPKSLWSYNPIPNGCVFYSPLWNPGLHGPVFQSIDPFGHTCTRTGGTMDGDGFTADTNEKIDCGNATVLRATDNITVIVRLKTPSSFGTAGSGLQLPILSRYDSDNSKRVWSLGLMNKDAAGQPTDVFGIFYGDPVDGTLEAREYYNNNLSVSTNYHLAWTFAGGASLLYVNGPSVVLTNFDGVVPSSLFRTDVVLNLNLQLPDTFGKQTIGEVWFYDGVLSATEIQYHNDKTAWRI